ncbi:MAG: pyruvate kinase, partial [Pseudomonadota bacterium]
MSFTPRRRKAKIIATLGPSSQPAKSLKAVFEAGADIFRLNMSHGDHGGKAEAIQTIRELERKTGKWPT